MNEGRSRFDRFARFLDAVLEPIRYAIHAETGRALSFAPPRVEPVRPAPRAEPLELARAEPPPEPPKPPKAKRPRSAKPSSEGRAKPRARRAKAGDD